MEEKPKMKSSHVPTGAMATIKDLNPSNNQVTIRACVTYKSDIKTWCNPRGEGTRFTMDLRDDSGEIRMTGFNTSVDKFYDMLEVNRVHDISWFTVKPANKQFTSIKHDYELSFNNDTRVAPCEEDPSDIPQATYNFVFIADIKNVDAGKIIDVLGMCKSVGDCQNTILKKTGEEVKKRELVLFDQTRKEIELTLWGKAAEEFCGGTQTIIAAKRVKVSDFAGKSLSCSSLLKKDPNLWRARALRKWHDREGLSLATQSFRRGRGPGRPAPWKLAVEASEVTSSDMEKSEIFMCKVTFMDVKSENAVYKACLKDYCKKKVLDMGNGMYKCEKCAAYYSTFKARLTLRCQFADFTGDFWATCFNETAAAVLNEKSDTLSQLYLDRRDEFDVLVKNAIFQQYIGKFKSKMESYNNEIRKNVTILELKPINHGEYAKQLLNEIRECSS